MKVLIIGAGGREHAIAWKIAQNIKVEIIYCAPGNGGTEKEGKCKNIDITDIHELATFAKNSLVDITIVGPEEPLMNGIVDIFKGQGLKVFGPSSYAANLEGSKIFSKDFMKKYGVKTAQYEAFYELEKAVAHLKVCEYPVVIKADGLAAGKGVVICQDVESSINVIEDFMIKDIFKGAGKSVVIEEFLDGVEASILSITDGKTILPFVSAKDHKQIFDNDEGPNTGGMGAIAPNPYCTKEVLTEFENNILANTLLGIVKEKMDYIGIIFFGIMITKKGVYLLEYNVRMGDPETQVVLSLMESDFLDLIQASIEGTLKDYEIHWKKGAACCVVATSGGYPGDYKKDITVRINEGIEGKVFIAGAVNKAGILHTNGGRVLASTCASMNLSKAIECAYKDMEKIKFEGMYFRGDIGK